MTDLYAQHILDHVKHPVCKQRITDESIEHSELNPACGDTISLQLRIEDGMIKEIGWDGSGCAISQAGMSLLAEHLNGTTVQEIENMHAKNMTNLLNVPISTRRLKCALLGLHTLKNALHTYNQEELQDWAKTVESSEKAR